MSARACGKARAAPSITPRSSASTAAGFSSGVMRQSSRKVTRSGTTLVLMPPAIRPTVNCGAPMPGVVDTRAARLPRQAYSAARMWFAASSASTPVNGRAAWAERPRSSTSRCRQPLWALTTAYENPAPKARSGALIPWASSQAGPISPPDSSS